MEELMRRVTVSAYHTTRKGRRLPHSRNSTKITWTKLTELARIRINLLCLV